MKGPRTIRTALVLATFLAWPRFALAAPIVIHWWLSGAGGEERIAEICEGFNRSQGEYRIVATYKGNYQATMNAGFAAIRAGTAPHILQVYQVGTGTMAAAKDAIKPVYEVMQESGLPFDAGAYLPIIARYYANRDGKMLSLPFACSTPVLYYNKAMFRKAGLDPEKPPATWPVLAEVARKLLAAGVCQYGLATELHSTVHIENLSAWHNVPIGTKDNGFGGLDATYTLNGPLQVKHIQQLADWQKSNVFFFGGRSFLSGGAFQEGKVAMLTKTSTGLDLSPAETRKDRFEVGIAMLPYWPDVKGAPQNTIISGNSLWVLKGHPAADYKGVAAFLNYLSKPELIAHWHQTTGYMPSTQAAYELTKKQGFYAKNPGAEIPLKQLTLHQPTNNSLGMRFGDHTRTRVIIENELDAIFAGRKTAQQGLDDAVKAGNELLRKFEKANR